MMIFFETHNRQAQAGAADPDVPEFPVEARGGALRDGHRCAGARLPQRGLGAAGRLPGGLRGK